MSSKIYRISADAVHEVIEEEAIIINMATGSYYNLDGSGGLIWELLQKGACSASTLAKAIESACTTDVSKIEEGINILLNELLAEGLLVPAEETVKLENLVRDTPLPFEAPVLNKYTDLEALLLIDPIHDVTSEGWPHVSSKES
jgi:hypothetical protein